MKEEKFEYQGKRKDQVESSIKAFVISFALAIFVLILIYINQL